jgi:hypothetical protein
MREWFSRYIVSGPESPEVSCESLKSPIALTLDLVFTTIFSVFRKIII